MNLQSTPSSGRTQSLTVKEGSEQSAIAVHIISLTGLRQRGRLQAPAGRGEAKTLAEEYETGRAVIS
jgi:hypothetical protein